MKYLCLIYRDVTPQVDEHERLESRGLGWGETTQVELNALHPVHDAVTIRVRGRKMAIAEGAHARPHHPLAEFCLIQARDLNDAIRIAARFPPAQAGMIEIRGIIDEPRREGGAPIEHEPG